MSPFDNFYKGLFLVPKAAYTVIFDSERCKGCELCVDACPKKILALSQTNINIHGFHPAEITDKTKCTGCKFCFLMCPDLAVTVLREDAVNE